MLPFIEAQELEEVLPKKVEVSVIDYSEDFEPSLLMSYAMDSAIVDDFEATDLETSNQLNEKGEEVADKEVQLGMILRHAYYQKITTPRWAKILSTESWRASFLKWRYYAQIEDYVRSTSAVVSKLKMNPSIIIPNEDSKKIEAVPNNQKDLIPKTPENDLKDSAETQYVQEEVVGNIREVTEEEVFEKDSSVVKEVVFNFSISDLSLPDSLISEQELYAIPVLPLSEILGDSLESDMSIQSVTAEDNSKEEKEKSVIINQESEIVEVESKDVSTVSTFKEKQIATVAPEIMKPTQEVKPNLISPVTISDRQTTTERFASMYSKLPWPVTGGVITDRYGYRKNAAARGLKRENYGIDISAPSSARVKAVFSGIVLMAIKQAPYDYIVTIKHGDFTSAYYFLEKVNVQVGDQVQVGQGIGTLRQQDGAAPFHFEIWQDQERVNPEPWLKS